jgi:hypothetical protein
MEILPSEIIDKIFTYTDPETCLANNKWYALLQFPEVDIEWAAEKGELRLIKLLVEKGKTRCNSAAMFWPAISGDLEMVKYLHEIVYADYGTAIVYAAAKSRHLEIIKYFYKINTEDIECAVTYAVQQDDLDTVKFLCESVDTHCTMRTMEWIGRNGNITMFKYFYDRELATALYSNHAMSSATINGRLEMVKYLHEVIGINTMEPLDCHCVDNNEVAEYIRGKVASPNCALYAMNCAAKDGNLEVVKYLHEKIRVPCSEYTLNLAIKNNCQDVVEYIRKN